MENPQAQMPQGQPGQAPEQMQQGAPQGQPQQGGQDPQMQQIMQLVQQMMQQGAQPADAAAELLAKQVPPEMIMQVFVQMGMPEQDAQAAIEQAMQGGQQPQNPGEEQMEGQASNPQEEMAEQSAPAPDQGGQPSPAEEIQMRYGGGMPRRLRSYAPGGDTQELQAVMQKVQEMMSQGSDARQVMEQIQAAAQQGQISPETATSVMEQLSGMQQATDPQGSDVTMTDGSQDPQALDPNVPAPDSAMGMAKFGGNLKKLMSRAYGGPAIAPGTDSKTYAQDRTSMFVGAVKNSAYKSTLDDEFPSLVGNQKVYGGDIPKAFDGFDVTKYKTADEAELAAYRYKQGLSPEEQAKFDVTSTLKTWKEPEFKAEAGKQYELDATTGKLKVVEAKTTNYGQASDWRPSNEPGIQMTYVNSKGEKIGANQYNQQFGNQQQNLYGYGAVNPVGYQNPMGNTFWDNVNAGASPFARMMSGIGTNNMYDPRITGANLPGGMNANQFLGAIGPNGLVPGMAGKIGEQNWRVGEAEKFKEGSIWKGNRRKGVRYQIDWGDAAAMNPAAPAQGPQNNPNANANASTNPQVRLNTMTQTGGSGMGAMERMDDNLFDQSAGNPAATATGNPASTNKSVQTTTGGSGMGMMNDENLGFPSLNESTVNTANQSLVAPGATDVVNPASEVNQIDQSAANLNGYPQNNQGQAPVFNGQQPVMSATAQDQVQQAPGVVQNSNYATYGNPTNTGVPGEFTPAEDLLPAGTENTTVVQKPGATVVQTPVKKKTVFSKVKPVDNVVKTATQTEDERRKAWNEKTAVSNAEYAKAQEAAKAEADKKPILHSSADYQKRLDQMQKDNNGQWSDEMQKFVDLKAQAEKREKGVQPKKKAPLMGKNLNVQAYGGEPGDCPEGMAWSEEDQACVPIANTPESKPLDASIAVGENNQFTANYSGAVGPNGIATSNVGFGYNPNENTSLKGSYDANNQSVMLQGKKTWDVGNGQLGVSGGYTAPVGGMNRGNFNGNVYYDTQLGKGPNAVPVKLNFGIGQQAYGGNVDPAALENAIALINRAFGGRIPRAVDGINLGSEDVDGNKIPDYLQAENLPADPFSNNGTIEQSAGKKLDINWNQVGAAAGDMYMNGAGKVTNFMNKMHAINPERDKAKLSALNRPSNTYDTMKQGLYGQQGDFIPNDIGNQVLNPTDTYYNNQQQIFSYGGKVYAIGGDVDLSEDEYNELLTAGFKLSRV